MNTNRSQIGLGLRSKHYAYLEKRPKTHIDWFEALSENYIDSYGRPREILELIRSDYPIALHGVSMSIASAEGPNINYLKKLKTLIREINPFIVSDHLCWTGTKQKNIHDLLPFPYNQESLKIISKNICQTQDILSREIILENLSSYMSFKSSDMNEFEFMSELNKNSGVKFLLDINNLYVSAVNLNLDPKKIINQIPINSIKQIHLAGHSDMGDYLFDTHSKPVCSVVWDLFSYFIQKSPNTPFMIEWDEDIPKFNILEKEALKAKHIWENNNNYHATRS